MEIDNDIIASVSLCPLLEAGLALVFQLGRAEFSIW